MRQAPRVIRPILKELVPTGPIEIILGDNPVESLAGYNMDWDEVFPESLVVSGTYLNAGAASRRVVGNGQQTIDVSGCPALETLNCKRFDGVLKTIFLRTGQTIKNLTTTPGAKIVYK